MHGFQEKTNMLSSIVSWCTCTAREQPHSLDVTNWRVLRGYACHGIKHMYAGCWHYQVHWCMTVGQHEITMHHCAAML